MLLARLSTTRFGDVVVVTIIGEVDRSNRTELCHGILDLVPDDCDGLVIDLAATRYLDSGGLDLLFDLQRRLRQRGKHLALHVPATALVGRTLAVTGADALIACADNLPDAVTLAQTDSVDP